MKKAKGNREDVGSGDKTEDDYEGGSSGGEEIALDDEDIDSVDEDAVPGRKIGMGNTTDRVLEHIHDTIKLALLPWIKTLTVSFPETINVDLNDYLNCELTFYKRALHGSKTVRSLATNHSLSFSRPDDFFAEMLNTDADVERIRQRFLDESAVIAKNEARWQEREGKKIDNRCSLRRSRSANEAKKSWRSGSNGSSLLHYSPK
ncbi:eukaryotic rRNA processing protein EBP2-domain-containing protein [Lactarius indigo]|nr:eukaryotic rRNA processing protein EBP2-domain-containing protein [Lactarius indigo]